MSKTGERCVGADVDDLARGTGHEGPMPASKDKPVDIAKIKAAVEDDIAQHTEEASE